MSRVSRVFKNVVINFSNAIVVSLLSLIFTIVIARYLGSSGYGLFSYALSYIAIVSVFNDFGFSTVAIREIAKDPSKTQRYFSNIFTVRLLISVIVFVIAAALIPLLRKDPLEIKILFLFTIAGFIFMFQLCFRWIFQAHQMFEYDALLNILQGIISLLLILAVIYFKKGLVAIAGTWIILNLIVTIVGIAAALRIVKFRISMEKELIRKLFSSAIVIGAISLITIMYLYVDKVILLQMKNSLEVGLYSAASKIMLFVRGMVFLYITVAYPAFSSFSVNLSDRYFHRFLNRSFYYILMLTAGISLGGMLLAAPIIKLIFGSGYAGAVPSLRIVIWALPLTCLSGLISCSCVSVNRQNESLAIYGTGLVVDLVVNLLFIGRYGYYATSVAIVLAETVMFIAFAIFAYKVLELRVTVVKLVQILLSLCVMGGFLFVFHSVNIVESIILGGAGYFASLLLFRAVNSDDWVLLKKILLKQI